MNSGPCKLMYFEYSRIYCKCSL